MNNIDLSLTGGGASAKSIALNDDVLKALRAFRNNAGYVVESWQEGSGWYHKYANGWIEQGGTYVQTKSNMSITFHKSLTNKNCWVFLQLAHPDGAGWVASASGGTVTKLTTTGFVGNSDVEHNKTRYWYAMGH